MKKLLIVSDAWHPQVNGVVRVIEAQKPWIEKERHEIVLLEPSWFKTMPMPMYPEIQVALFPSKKVEEFIEKEKPDAIHIVTEGTLGWAARRYCVKNNIPFTTWYHTHFDLYIDTRIPGLLYIVRKMLRRFHAPAVRTMVSTPTLKASLEEMGFTHLVVVPLGVDTERFVHSEALPSLPKPVFLYFGRLAPEKSPEEFLRLKLPGTKLVIGDGPLRKKLEKKYGSEATFVGYKRGQELIDWISIADVFVFPSRTETFGLVTLEALACGVPVAAYDVMGPRDVITSGKDGYLSYDLEDAAQKCLTLSSEECRATALKYSWERSAKGLVENLVHIN